MDELQILTPDHQDLLVQAMWEQRKEICDLDADVLDALSAIWLATAKTPDDKVIADVDQLLAMRGLKQKMGGQCRRGGYAQKQRAQILKALSHIYNLWITVELDIFRNGQRRKRGEACQSRPFVITDTRGQMRIDGYLDVQSFVFLPGLVFGRFLWGPGRQVAALSAKALHYDPYRQTWEKRLARYLSWQWKIRARTQNFEQPYLVDTLLEVIGEQPTAEKTVRKPMRIKLRFERALRRLAQDSVIAGWRYPEWDERACNVRGWARRWLGTSIIVEPPDAIRLAYERIPQ